MTSIFNMLSLHIVTLFPETCIMFFVIMKKKTLKF